MEDNKEFQEFLNKFSIAGAKYFIDDKDIIKETENPFMPNTYTLEELKDFFMKQQENG